MHISSLFIAYTNYTLHCFFKTSHHRTPLVFSSFVHLILLYFRHKTKVASMSTIITKAPSSNNETSECDSSEESGWTKYFEDFLNNHHFDDHKCCSVSLSGVDNYSSTSFVSVAKKMSTDDGSTNSSVKKRKKIKTSLVVDDALEDTASSPIKGSKALYMRTSYTKHREKMDNFQEKGNSPGERDERQEVGFNRRDNDHTELKKKGLCLVPLKVIVKYIG